MAIYSKHVFICTNDRKGMKKSCQDAHALEMCAYAKEKLRSLPIKNHNIRISSAGCLGRCSEGPAIVVYPEGKWYTYNNRADIDKIISSILAEHTVPDNLVLTSEND